MKKRKCSRSHAAPHAHALCPYLLLLQPPQRLGDELDVLAGQRGQLAVSCPQVHVLQQTVGSAGGEHTTVTPAPPPRRAVASPRTLPVLQPSAPAEGAPGSATCRDHPEVSPLTSWMMLSDADCTLGFLAGEAMGSTCALKVTSCSS